MSFFGFNWNPFSSSARPPPPAATEEVQASTAPNRPSRRFIKHGYLDIGEQHDDRIHNTVSNGPMPDWVRRTHEEMGITETDPLRYRNMVRYRNMDMRSGISQSADYPKYYTDAEIESMRSEIKPAECPICLDTIQPGENCLKCRYGHKCHRVCPTIGNAPVTRCPVCRNTNMRVADSVNDVFTGGRRRRMRRKTLRRRKSRTRRTRLHRR